MPVSALFILMMGAGGFLLYAAVKDEHPWSLFTSTVKGAATPTVTTGSAPYTGALNTVNVQGQPVQLPQGVNVGPGGSLHG